MKLRLILGVSLIVLLLAGWLNRNHASTQANLYIEKPATSIGPFPVVNGLITVSDSLTFLVDTGSDLCVITPATLDYLKRNGCKVSSSFCPIVWNDNTGDKRLSWTRYTIDVPVSKWVTNCTHDGIIFYQRQPGKVTEIKNMNFVLCDDAKVNVIGIDFLEKFAMEYRVAESSVTFYNDSPEGYEVMTTLKPSHNLLKLLGCGNRYYIDLTIGMREKDYFIDTALDLVQVKKPLCDTIYTSQLEEGSIITTEGEVLPAKFKRDMYAKLGIRSGKVLVSFYDDDDEDYSVNPFRFSRQDVLINFPKRTFEYRPQFNMK